MHILYTQTAYPPSLGGAQAYLHALAQTMQARHSVQVCTFWAEQRTDWLLGTTLRAPGGADYWVDGVPVARINLTLRDKWRAAPWVAGYYVWSRASLSHLAAQLLPHLRRVCPRPEVVHHGRVGREPLAFASLALAREVGAPFVLTPFHHPRWGGWLHRHYQWLYRQADGVIALTPAEKQTLIHFGVSPERIVVTGAGAVLADQPEPDAFRQQFQLGDAPLILFLGQKYPYKGYEQLLQAAPLVWARHPQARFFFLGPRTRASQRTFRRVRDPRIVELGAVSLPDKTNALAACTVLCVPSTQESFGSVYLEAWLMGKPVVAGAIPAVAQVVTDGVDGFLCLPQADCLAQRLNQLLDQPEVCATIGAAGRHKALERYSWPALAQQTEDLYRRLL